MGNEDIPEEVTIPKSLQGPSSHESNFIDFMPLSTLPNLSML